MDHPYLIIKGTETDDVNDANSTTLTFAVKGIQPVFEKTGEDKMNIAGGIRASRSRILKFVVPFVSMLVDIEDDTGDYGQYWEYQKLLDKYEYIWFKETNYVRVMADGSNLWDTLLPIKVELVEDSLDPLFEEGADEMSATFQTRERINIQNY